MRSQKVGKIFAVAASAVLMASLALTGCSKPESTDSATSTESSSNIEVTPATGTETTVLAVSGMT